MDEKLFSEFAPVSTQEWEEIIQKDLKGADYEKRLVWRTDEGFNVRPYYRAEDLKNIDYLNALPNEFPYTRGGKTNKNEWEIVQQVSEKEPKKANAIALAAIQGGATTIAFCAKNIQSYSDMEMLLSNINLEEIGIKFHHASAYLPLIELFMNYIRTHSFDMAKIRGGLGFDAVAFCLKNAKFYRSQKEDMEEAIALIHQTATLPNFKVIDIQGIIIHNAGATLVQELGYALAIANEYLAFATHLGLPIGQVAEKMEMTLSISSNYFMEIAKLRSARLLWATMVEAYQPREIGACQSFINSVASSWNKTIYDPYVNMLRTTTEGMSAAIGGADSITLQPFNVAYQPDDDFSRRISRNVQNILKEESYFDQVIDPAAGSYYIENLTDAISEHAWKLFQTVETAGGMIATTLKGEIKAEIEKSCQKRDMDIATRKYVLLGTNQYPNIQENMLDKIQLPLENEKHDGLQTYRGAQSFEALRLETEKYSQSHTRPTVFMLKIGNLAMRQARAGFATNFFGCAGYQIVESAGYKTVAEGIQAAQAAKANIVVLCSSDEEYATLGVEAAQAAKNAGFIFIIAGNPVEAMENLKNAGTDDFIHVKTNVLTCLQHYNNLLFNHI